MSIEKQQDTFELIRRGFDEMAKEEIAIAPWLVMNRNKQRLDDQLRAKLKAVAAELSETFRDARILWWTDVQITPGFRRQAYFEVLLSTAAYLSYMRLGTLIITDEMVAVSISLLRRYLKRDGGSALLSVYTRVANYLNGQALRYYGRVPEDIFLSGAWHRPWMDYSLDNELKFGLTYGLYQQTEIDGKRFVELTETGEALFLACLDDLDKCGYLRQREQLIRASNFTSMDDYEQMMEHGNPEVHENRRSLVQWSGIKPGMKVLELGCGAGALTLDDGLYLAVGKHGEVVATDPAVGMLARAKVKLERYDAPNVVFQRAAAEKLPFPDNAFDAVVGMLFLHFTDIRQAFAEISRVTKPGGTFTTLYVLDFSPSEQGKFFAEWFYPVFQMGLASTKSGVLPTSDLVPSIAGDYFSPYECVAHEWMGDLSNVEEIVKFYVQGGTMAELNELPWEARNELFRDLIDRGYKVKEKYGADGMRNPHQGQWFKGTVLK